MLFKNNLIDGLFLVNGKEDDAKITIKAIMKSLSEEKGDEFRNSLIVSLEMFMDGIREDAVPPAQQPVQNNALPENVFTASGRRWFPKMKIWKRK